MCTLEGNTGIVAASGTTPHTATTGFSICAKRIRRYYGGKRHYSAGTIEGAVLYDSVGLTWMVEASFSQTSTSAFSSSVFPSRPREASSRAMCLRSDPFRPENGIGTGILPLLLLALYIAYMV